MSDGYYDRQGNPVTDRAAQMELVKNKRVALTKIGADGPEVSTVHLVLDHGYDGGAPVIFETLVFGGALDQEMERYCTEAEAVAGHAAMVERVRKSYEAEVAIPSPSEVTR